MQEKGLMQEKKAQTGQNTSVATDLEWPAAGERTGERLRRKVRLSEGQPCGSHVSHGSCNAGHHVAGRIAGLLRIRGASTWIWLCHLRISGLRIVRKPAIPEITTPVSKSPAVANPNPRLSRSTPSRVALRSFSAPNAQLRPTTSTWIIPTIRLPHNTSSTLVCRRRRPTPMMCKTRRVPTCQ